jgi:hypothetical protein
LRGLTNEACELPSAGSRKVTRQGATRPFARRECGDFPPNLRGLRSLKLKTKVKISTLVLQISFIARLRRRSGHYPSTSIYSRHLGAIAKSISRLRDLTRSPSRCPTSRTRPLWPLPCPPHLMVRAHPASRLRLISQRLNRISKR